MTVDGLVDAPAGRRGHPGGRRRGGDRPRVMRTARTARMVAVAGLAALTQLWLPDTASSASRAPQGHAAPAATSGGWVNTKWGPIGPGDRDLLLGVRRAGLWETPAGQMAMDKGGSDRVKEVGRLISEQHIRLIRPASSQDGGLNPIVIWLLLAVAAVAGGVTTLRVLRAR